MIKAILIMFILTCITVIWYSVDQQSYYEHTKMLDISDAFFVCLLVLIICWR
jgi:hypothetical protein